MAIVFDVHNAGGGVAAVRWHWWARRGDNTVSCGFGRSYVVVSGWVRAFAIVVVLR